MHGQARFADHVRGWLVAGGLGLFAGFLVGLGGMGTYTHVRWPALAGLVIGVASSVAAPTRRILVAFCGGGITVVAAVVTTVSIQVHRGRWPITDEFTVAHHGTTTQATLRAAIMLGVLIGVPCMMAAVLVAVAKRCDRAGARQAAVPDAAPPRL
jgi:hypothetical protein